MRKILFIFITLFSTITLWGQNNYALYSIEDVKPICLTPDGKQLFGIEVIEGLPKLKQIDLQTGEVQKQYELSLNPKNLKILITSADGEELYIITSKEGENERKPFLDAIYSFDLSKGKLKKQYSDKENRLCPSRVELLNNKLILTHGFDASLQYDIENRQLGLLSDNPDLRLFSIAPEQKGCIMVNIKEGEGDVNPLYLLDEMGNLSEKLAEYDSRMTFSTNESENRLPHLIISKPENNWIEKAYTENCFPVSMFEIASHKKWSNLYAGIDKEEPIATLLAANDTYLLAASRSKIFVYNHAEPQTTNPNLVSGSELESLKAFLESKITYEKSKIHSTAMGLVFDASFYRVDITTKLDEYSYSSDKFFAFNLNNEFTILKDCDELTELMRSDFVLSNIEKALLFEEVLDVFYPVGTFDVKDKDRYQINNTWMFVREESFGDLKGYEVTVDDSGKVQHIQYSNKLEKQ